MPHAISRGRREKGREGGKNGAARCLGTANTRTRQKRAAKGGKGKLQNEQSKNGTTRNAVARARTH